MKTLNDNDIELIFQEYAKETLNTSKEDNIGQKEVSKEEESKGSSHQSIKLETLINQQKPIIITKEVIDKGIILTKTDFLLSILEIGTFPKNYQKNFPYPERKYFWYKITQKNSATQKLFHPFFQKYSIIPPVKIKEIFSVFNNLANPETLSKIIKESEDEINKSSLR